MCFQAHFTFFANEIGEWSGAIKYKCVVNDLMIWIIKRNQEEKYCQLSTTNISIIDRIQLLYELGWCKNNCGFYLKLWCGFGNKLLFNYIHVIHHF